VRISSANQQRLLRLTNTCEHYLAKIAPTKNRVINGNATEHRLGVLKDHALRVSGSPTEIVSLANHLQKEEHDSDNGLLASSFKTTNMWVLIKQKFTCLVVSQV
jgi:hypothetical protein